MTFGDSQKPASTASELQVLNELIVGASNCFVNVSDEPGKRYFWWK